VRNTYKTIEYETWKRKPYCDIYRHAALPQYCVSLVLDVTRFKAYVKDNRLPFTPAFVFAVTKCANEIEEFRCRFLDGKVVLFDSIDTSFTCLDRETELFKMVDVPMQDTMEQYVRLAVETAKAQKLPFAGPAEPDTYQFSALPWVSFTHISHTDFGDSEKAQPIFDWGKYTEKDGVLTMPFAVQVHHAFVDGIHIGRFTDRLQSYLNEL
jgi:chloramphenicol O-acetyltransferase type B